MAARRGKSQARRNAGNNGLPGWAWMVLGIVLTIIAVLFVPKLLKSDGDGFFRPQPNPDAQPAPVSTGDEELVAPVDRDENAAAEPPAETETEFDFYTLLPGKEVPMTDAELAASERAEKAREAAANAAPTPATPATATDPRPLPTPVDESAPRTAATDSRPATSAAGTTTATTPAAEPADDDTRYILQAGAFQASGQAEELKAKIALLGVGARVESAQIGGKTVYRVRMGPYGSAGELADAKRKLASGGLSAMAIKTQ